MHNADPPNTAPTPHAASRDRQGDSALAPTLGPLMLWGLGVGYVISGEYFGWNLGLPHGGPVGMLIALAVVSVMYVAFVLSYAELACALPRAGGAFVYAGRAPGPRWGLVAGLAQWVEFVFAPPAIAAAIGAYFRTWVPGADPLVLAVLAYLAFTGLNIYGVKQSAAFELGVTVLAVFELLLFAGVTLPSFSTEAFLSDPPPLTFQGVFAALPFAIWFYLAIEGVANVAEEARDPQRDIPRGFGSAIFTLVTLAVLTFFAAVGVDGWKSVVYPAGGTEASDSPLPLALGHVVGQSHALYHLLVGVGLFGLIASFHGIILIAGRATLALAREDLLPRRLAKTLPGRKTPAAALVFNLLVGVGALMTGRTGEIITLSVFGALTMYAIAMVAMLRLRRDEPALERPYRTPGGTALPRIALVLAAGCLVAVAYSAPTLAGVYVGVMVAGAALATWLGRRARG